MGDQQEIYIDLEKRNSIQRREQPGTCANSKDPDETAYNQPPHEDLHCLQFILFYFRLKLFLYKWMCPNSKTEESNLETQGRIG